MNRRFARERRVGQLAAAVRDHLVHVHVELSAAPGHPYMQWKHVVMLAGEYLVTGINDQFMGLVLEPLAGMVRVGGGFLQNRIRGAHLARHEVLTYPEVLHAAFRLSPPYFLLRDL